MRCLLRCLAILLVLPSLAQAQRQVTLDLNAGVGGGNGRGTSPDFLVLGASLLGEVGASRQDRIVVGLGFLKQARGPSGDVGYRQPDGSIGGPWPFFTALNATAAVDLGRSAVGARITGGVGAYRDNFHYTTGGVSASIDLSLPGHGPAGLLLAFGGSILPAYRGEAFRMAALSIGLRVRTPLDDGTGSAHE